MFQIKVIIYTYAFVDIVFIKNWHFFCFADLATLVRELQISFSVMNKWILEGSQFDRRLCDLDDDDDVGGG